MNTEREVHEVLSRALPPQPGTEGWVREAKRRHTRRQVVTGSVAAMAVLALAVPAALQLTRDGVTVAEPSVSPTPSVTSTPSVTRTATQAPTQTTTPKPSVTPTSVPTSVPTGQQKVEYGTSQAFEHCVQYAGKPTTLPGGELPAGAERLWMCDLNTEGDIIWVGPQEPLTSGVEEAITAYNAAPVIGAERNCSQAIPYGRSMTVVAEYADGSRKVVNAAAGGCDMLSDGTVARSGANAWLDTLTALWRAQRADGRATPAPDAEICGGTTVLDYSPAEAARGFVCGAPSTLEDPSTELVSRAIPADLLARLSEDVAKNSVALPIPTTQEGAVIYAARTALSGSLLRITLQNRWGDAVNIHFHAPDSWLWDANGTLHQWKPTGDLAAALGGMTRGLWTVDVFSAACQTDSPLVVRDAPLGGVTTGMVCGPDGTLGVLPPSTAKAVAAGFESAATPSDQPKLVGGQVWLLSGDRFIVLDVAAGGLLVRTLDDGSTVSWAPPAAVVQSLRDVGVTI